LSAASPDPAPLTGRPTRYLQIAQALAADIADGRYPVGDLLPAEAELCAHFGVSRATVREALRRLQQLGLVSRAQGIGTRVEERQAKSTYIMAADSVEQVAQYTAETELVLREIADITADEALAAELGGQPGQAWVRLGGLRSVPGDPAGPFCWTAVHLAARFGELRHDLSLGEPIRTPIYRQVCDRFGLRIGEVRQSVRAVAMDADGAGRFGVPPGSPGLSIRRQYLALDATPIETALNLYPAGRFEYAMRLRLTPGA
jgi:DNA-binding GntR family transcriptional regulator